MTWLVGVAFALVSAVAWGAGDVASEATVERRGCVRVLVDESAVDFFFAEAEVPEGRPVRWIERTWDSMLERLVRGVAREETLITSRALPFQGMSGVWRTEIREGDSVRVEYTKLDVTARRKYVWAPERGTWRVIESWPIPVPADGRTFSVERYREDGSGKLEYVAQYRWVAIPEFLCPFDGQTYRNVFAEELLRAAVPRGGGGYRRLGFTHGRSVRYFAHGRGFFYGLTEEFSGSAGSLAKPDAQGLRNDWLLQ